ncbi:hypothetical protein THAOC_33214 [Thalassiosira oceanica]|uniref:Uncharacterized protein n=1 Tax=Thalassiosira oceanica TaxID=159749 RepID=K0R5K3_THAOC|nr:hypothetical protein THAOC_33214 [Thalassiosira oceanica]|eukprot:EJK48025.1 hypothetical protein THAOC_33214 [Thalassiosira oceanica]
MRSTSAVPRQILVRPRQPSALEDKLATFSLVGQPSSENAGSSAASSTAWLVEEYRRIRRQQLVRKGAERTLYVLLGLVAVCFLGVRTGYSRMSKYFPRATKPAEVYIPASLDEVSQRRLTLNLGGGNCKWQPPIYDVPETIDFHKTVIAGFPSGDKRMIFIQMEALSGWPAKDEWDFKFLGLSNHPFIKANYPHHEGIWGWGDNADQVVMMVRNIRKSMVEFDYYMEGGLMRDIYTHRITTPHHWNMVVMPTAYTRDELEYDSVVGDEIVTPSYDPMCATVTDGCAPAAVISAEKLREHDVGATETAAIANVLHNDNRMGQYVIDSSTWDCVWDEVSFPYFLAAPPFSMLMVGLDQLIVKKKGLRTVYDRPGLTENDYNFSEEMLETMIQELDYIINKYSGPDWNTKSTAIRLVELISEHKTLVETELAEVVTGRRKLSDKDFLGPKARARKNVMNADAKDYSKYFYDLEKEIAEKKEIRKMARAARIHKRQQGRVDKRKARGKTKPLPRNVHEDGPDKAKSDHVTIDEWREYLSV